MCHPELISGVVFRIYQYLLVADPFYLFDLWFMSCVNL